MYGKTKVSKKLLVQTRACVVAVGFGPSPAACGATVNLVLLIFFGKRRVLQPKKGDIHTAFL
jgi:hypothetical protein